MNTILGMKKVSIAILLLLSLGACSKYGEMKSDEVIGVTNQNEIHKLTYGTGSLHDLSIYYPIKTNNLDMKNMEVENTDTFGNAQINQYTVSTPPFHYNHVFFLPIKVDCAITSENNIFSKNHYRTSDSVIGTYVFNHFDIEIYKMSKTFNSDIIYIGIVHPKKEGQTSQALNSDTILANYNNTQIHELEFEKDSIFSRNPYIFFATDSKNNIMPLSSEMAFPQGKSTVIVRSNLVLLDENNHLIEQKN